MSYRNDTAEVVGKMVHALSKKNKDFALGYLETFLTNLIEEHVKDSTERSFLHTRMLCIAIDQLIDTKKLS